MTTPQLAKLVAMLRANGVKSYVANGESVEIYFHDPLVNAPTIPDVAYVRPETPATIPQRVQPPANAAPPKAVSIPHYPNEVNSLLKLSDTELVNRLFPDYTQGE